MLYASQLKSPDGSRRCSLRIESYHLARGNVLPCEGYNCRYPCRPHQRVSLLRTLLGFFLFNSMYLDRCIRAHPETDTTCRTMFLIDHFRVWTPLFVEIVRHAKNFLRAKHDTHPASFTAVPYKMNFLHCIPYHSTLFSCHHTTNWLPGQPNL